MDFLSQTIKTNAAKQHIILTVYLSPIKLSLSFKSLSVQFTGQKLLMYEGRPESKERFAIQRYLLIIGKKQNMQVLSHTFTYFST